MSAQLIEEEVLFEVTVQEDFTTTHLMVPADDQWMKLNEWFGSIKLVHQTALHTFTNRSEKCSDSILGSVIASIASAPSLLAKLPASAVGHKMNELVQWLAEGYTDAESDDGQSVTLSGNDFAVKEDGTVWLAMIGDTSVTLNAEQMRREPVSAELFYNVMDDSDTAALVINYRDEAVIGSILTLV